MLIRIRHVYGKDEVLYVCKLCNTRVIHAMMSRVLPVFQARYISINSDFSGCSEDVSYLTLYSCFYNITALKNMHCRYVTSCIFLSRVLHEGLLITKIMIERSSTSII